MDKKHIVVLTSDQQRRLQLLVTQGTASPRTLTRAQILLMAATGTSDGSIAAATAVSAGLVERVRKRFVEAGWEAAIEDRQGSGFRRNLSANGTSTILAHGTTSGKDHQRAWVLKLVEDKFVEFRVFDPSDPEWLPQVAFNDGQRWRPREWSVPSISPTFVWRMEDVLNLYAAPYNPHRPLVCFDERPYQLIQEPGDGLTTLGPRGQQSDCRYQRERTCYLFMLFQPQQAWRHAAVMERRSALEVAHCLQALVDVHFPQAELIRIVTSNLASYTPAVLYETFPAAEAQRIASRLEWHYTPVRGNWLNMAQIELSLLVQEQLDRPIPTIEALETAVAACVSRRNLEQATIHWQLTTPQVRDKLEHLYAR